MRTPSLMKSGRSMVVVALSALVPLVTAQAEPMDSATPTYSGEDRRPFQSGTPGAEGPVRSDTMQQDSTRLPGDPYAAPAETGTTIRGAEGPVRSETMQKDSMPGDPSYAVPAESGTTVRGAEGPARSEVETQGYVGDRMRMTQCPNSTSEKFAPNAYYGEGNPFSSAEGTASFLGKGRWC